MLLAVPFKEIGGKQKNTIASICDKKGNLVKLFVNPQEIEKSAQDRAL